MNRFNFRSFFLIFCPLIGYLGFIFFLSSLKQSQNQIPIPNLDKVIHFCLYLPMPILFFLFLRQSQNNFIKYNFWAHGIILSLLYAASDEWHQSFVPTRRMDFFDWLADAAGIFAGAFLYRLFLRWRRGHENS